MCPLTCPLHCGNGGDVVRLRYRRGALLHSKLFLQAKWEVSRPFWSETWPDSVQSTCTKTFHQPYRLRLRWLHQLFFLANTWARVRADKVCSIKAIFGNLIRESPSSCFKKEMLTWRQVSSEHSDPASGQTNLLLMFSFYSFRVLQNQKTTFLLLVLHRGESNMKYGINSPDNILKIICNKYTMLCYHYTIIWAYNVYDNWRNWTVVKNAHNNTQYYINVTGSIYTLVECSSLVTIHFSIVHK